MPSTLPTESAWSKAVKDFGIGPYDGAPDSSMKGENDEHREPTGKSLPDGGSIDDQPLEYYLGYPQEEAVGWKHASGLLPGDLSDNRPPRSNNPDWDTKVDVVPTMGPPSDSNNAVSDHEEKDYDMDHSKLPGGKIPSNPNYSQLPSGNLPVARSDYYDRTVIGTSIDQIWPSDDSGAYVSGTCHEYVDVDEDTDEEDSTITSASELPFPGKSDIKMGDFLESFGNANQGFVWEDTSGPIGFPSEEFKENVDFPKSNDGTLGQLVANSNEFDSLGNTMHNSRISTDIKLVISLTKDFIKEFGKKNIVRRHVLSFLQDRSLPQFLASDIIRCMKHQHKVVIPDVMDTFPLAKISSDSRIGLGSIHMDLTNLLVRYYDDPVVLKTINRCSSNICDVIAEIDLNNLDEVNSV